VLPSIPLALVVPFLPADALPVTLASLLARREDPVNLAELVVTVPFYSRVAQLQTSIPLVPLLLPRAEMARNELETSASEISVYPRLVDKVSRGLFAYKKVPMPSSVHALM